MAANEKKKKNLMNKKWESEIELIRTFSKHFGHGTHAYRSDFVKTTKNGKLQTGMKKREKTRCRLEKWWENNNTNNNNNNNNK